MLVVTASDGQGLMLSVSGFTSTLSYNADGAFPANPDGSLSPLPCGPSAARPHIVSATPTSATLQFSTPRIYSDCDPGSEAGQAFTAGLLDADPCSDHFNTMPLALGHVYTSSQLCGDRPNVDKTKWTDTTKVPDVTGSVTISPLPAVTQPPTCTSANQSTCNCLYIGGTVAVSGVESSGITGFAQLAGALAPSPKAIDVSARLSGGIVSVSFRTNTEVGLAGINIWTNEKGKGPALVTSVAPKGGGEAGASYSVDIKRGAFKSGTDVVVETVTSTGRFKSDAVRF